MLMAMVGSQRCPPLICLAARHPQAPQDSLQDYHHVNIFDLGSEPIGHEV